MEYPHIKKAAEAAILEGISRQALKAPLSPSSAKIIIIID
jgi:hypothetical protein